MRTLFPDALTKPTPRSDAVLREARAKSLTNTRAAFRVIQAARHGVLSVSDGAIQRWTASSEENAALMGEISAAANYVSCSDRLRLLGTPAVTSAAYFWIRRFHPGKFEDCAGTLRVRKDSGWREQLASWNRVIANMLGSRMDFSLVPSARPFLRLR
jgi:hypothetical protein